jgi:hypothetical protein
MRKNPHAVALGRLGGLAGGRQGGLARARVLSPERRREIARLAASARWAPTTTNGGELASTFPGVVRQLLKTYNPAQLRWQEASHRWVIVAAIVTRGSEEAQEWLARRLSMGELRKLARRFKGAGLNEPDRARIRAKLGLDKTAIPSRPYLGFTWGDGKKS